MSRVHLHPKHYKNCVFCEYWNGNADLVFKTPAMGYEFENSVVGKCMKTGWQRRSGQQGCPKYTPSREAEKLL